MPPSQRELAEKLQKEVSGMPKIEKDVTAEELLARAAATLLKEQPPIPAPTTTPAPKA